MNLQEFISEFVEHNTLIRLVFKVKGGHEVVLDSWNDVSMEHEVLKGKGKFKDYVDYDVSGVTDILVTGNYSEAINIVIKEPDKLKLRSEKINNIIER